MNWYRFFVLVVALCLVCSGVALAEGLPVKVAAIYALSGGAEANNKSSVAGVKCALDVMNEQGGVLGRPVELLFFDNQSTAIGSMQAAEAAARAGARVIIGPAWSSHAIAVARVAQHYGIPQITDMATNPRVTEVGDCIFRVCFTDDFQGLVMARFAMQDLKARTTMSIVNMTSDYSLGLAENYSNQFAARKGTVFPPVYYKPNNIPFEEITAAVLKRNPDVLFVPGHHESGAILKHLVRAGMRSIPLGGDGWLTDAFMKSGGDTVSKGYYCSHWSPELASDNSREFMERCGGESKHVEGMVQDYDALMLWGDAVRRAGSVEPGPVRAALAATRDWEGASGRLSLNAQGDPTKSAVIMAVESGSTRFHKVVEPQDR